MSHLFSVWAPSAESVEVVIELASGDLQRSAMNPVQQDPSARWHRGPTRGGWWAGQVEDAGVATRYWFSLDGGPLLPDPRSTSQPEGPHGPSEVTDTRGFGWTDESWRGLYLPSSAIYECHVGTFSPSGDFAGVADRLGHLSDLGVDVLELMPVAEFPGLRGWGYDGVDLYAPHHRYGGPVGLAGLVDAAHGRGIGVFLDVVYNHLGPDGNYLSAFGPYFTDRHSTPWGAGLNLDGPYSDGVRAFLIENALYWLEEYHLDGLRLDAVHAIYDSSAAHFLEELSTAVAELGARLGRKLWLVAESDLNDPWVVRPVEAAGLGMDAQWSDDFHHALWAALTGERAGYYRDFGDLGDLAACFEGAFARPGAFSGFRGRRHGRAVGDLAPWRFLAYVQNHDQVGNRAKGERMGSLLTPRRQKVALGVVLCSPFVPLLFQGEEWGATTPFLYFTDHTDPGLAEAVSMGRRREFAAFGWQPEEVPDPQDPGSFAASVLDWSQSNQAVGRELQDWVRQLLALRRSEAFQPTSHFEDITATADGSVLIVRRARSMMVANFSQERACVSFDTPLEGDGGWEVAAACGGVGIEEDRLCIDGESFAFVWMATRR